MWVTFGKKPELMYLEQFFAFQLQVLMCVRWQEGGLGKGLEKITSKSTYRLGKIKYGFFLEQLTHPPVVIWLEKSTAMILLR